MRQMSIITALGLAFLIGATETLAGGIKISGPVIELSPSTYDFGTLAQESLQRLQVTIRNSGTDELCILKVDSDCGCAVAELPDSSIAPGDTLVMRVTFTTRHYSGRIAKHVFLKTNDPGAPQARLTLKAFVRSRVLMRPAALDFGDLPRGQTASQVVTITAAAEDTLLVREIVIPNETFENHLERHVERDSTVYHLRISVRADAPVGPFSARAVIETNQRSAKHLSLSLKGQIHGFFKAEPTLLALGQLRQGMVRQRSLRLIAQRPGTHHVLGAVCSSERLNVHVTPIEEGRIYEITVTVPVEVPRGKILAKLRIETDDPDQPELLIPVRGSVRRARAEGS
ncbi:MAG: DUF1573 domain-containing protein [Candidatus Eisenbacteria sp.]|nr:DUF1573 domain-containing protein [Candidatus Eisenbacteria bacterium]